MTTSTALEDGTLSGREPRYGLRPPAQHDDDLLLARSETSYDAHGRGYQTMTYAVEASGTVGNALVSNTWYDAAGNAIKQQSAGSGSFTKTAYDGLGRAIKRHLGHTTVTESYSEAQSVANDVIFEQSETTYDEASNVIRPPHGNGCAMPPARAS